MVNVGSDPIKVDFLQILEILSSCPFIQFLGSDPLSTLRAARTK